MLFRHVRRVMTIVGLTAMIVFGWTQLEAQRKQIRRLEREIARLESRDRFIDATIHNNEYEVHPFNHFTFTRIYPSVLGLGKRVVERPIGSKRKELMQVIGDALHVLHNRSANDFIEGIYSNDPFHGTHYQLYFRTLKSRFYHKVTVFRPFSLPKIVSNELVSTQRERIHLILPVSEDRAPQLTRFLDNVRRLNDGRLKVFLVYFGELRSLELPYDSVQVLHASNSSRNFSRAKALHFGASTCCRNASLLFFCDIDSVFTLRFLERCRLNASRAKKVYYPILFSLYNPKYSRVHVDNGHAIPISSATGFWRDFGFGMTCQYKSDFMSVGGFSQAGGGDDGWGGEDVLLYRRHLQHPRLTVIRAVDPGLFHVWHVKQCNRNALTDEQYASCVSTRALNEASHAQMAQQLMKLTK